MAQKTPKTSAKLAIKAADAVQNATTTMNKSKSGSKERKGGELSFSVNRARIAALGDWRG